MATYQVHAGAEIQTKSFVVSKSATYLVYVPHGFGDPRNLLWLSVTLKNYLKLVFFHIVTSVLMKASYFLLCYITNTVKIQIVFLEIALLSISLTQYLTNFLKRAYYTGIHKVIDWIKLNYWIIS